MEIQLINEELISVLRAQAQNSERLRQHFDLRTTPEDNSQRMLNVLEVGTKVPIHRHEGSNESFVCLKGRLDIIIFEKLSSGEEFKEIFRTELNPSKGNYGVQVPLGVWHTVDVKEPSVIFEAMDGAYAP